MLKGKIGLIVLIMIVLVTLYRFYNKSFRLDRNGDVIMGVVIDEISYTKNSHLSSSTNKIHRYMFKIQNKIYKGNSQNSKYKVGDSILVRYLPANPSENNPDEIYSKKK